MTEDRTWIDEWLVRVAGQPEHAEVVPGVTKGEVLDLLRRPATPDGAVYLPDVVYGTAGAGGRPLTLHAYGRADASERAPGVVLIHGGGFHDGHPNMHIRHAAELAAHGYTAATISYRRVHEATWPAALEDAKCAVRWMRANHEQLGLDPERIAVAGGSAGGHLAAMVALTPGRFEGTGGHEHASSRVQAAVLFYPATDLNLPGAPSEVRTAMAAFLGADTAELFAEASPITHVHRDAPPILSITGDADALTTLPMIEAFHRELDVHDVPNRLEVRPGAIHAFDLVREQDWRYGSELMLSFLATHLQPTADRS